MVSIDDQKALLALVAAIVVLWSPTVVVVTEFFKRALASVSAIPALVWELLPLAVGLALAFVYIAPADTKAAVLVGVSIGMIATAEFRVVHRITAPTP